MTFMNDPLPESITWKFNLSGKRREFVMTASEMTAGQMMDFTSVSDGEDPLESIHNIVACLMLTGGKYIPYTETCEDVYENMPISIAYPYMLFFSRVGKGLPEAILTYSGKKKRRKKITVGAGITPYTG